MGMPYMRGGLFSWRRQTNRILGLDFVHYYQIALRDFHVPCKHLVHSFSFHRTFGIPPSCRHRDCIISRPQNLDPGIGHSEGAHQVVPNLRVAVRHDTYSMNLTCLVQTYLASSWCIFTRARLSSLSLVLSPLLSTFCGRF